MTTTYTWWRAKLERIRGYAEDVGHRFRLEWDKSEFYWTPPRDRAATYDEEPVTLDAVLAICTLCMAERAIRRSDPRNFS